MPMIAMVVEYRGGDFFGWQAQPGLRTVQSELESVLRKILRGPLSVVNSSGRTDSGVHATAQVVAFSVADPHLEIRRLALSVSSLMRGSLAVVRAGYVDDDFHPRRGIASKEYTYILETRKSPPVLDLGRVWHLPGCVDIELIKRNAPKLCGTHDFTSFKAAGCQNRNPVKTISNIQVLTDGSRLKIVFQGSGFLKQMVRILVGTLVDISQEKISMAIPAIIAARDRLWAGVTAPPQGLYLTGVQYTEPRFHWLNTPLPANFSMPGNIWF